MECFRNASHDNIQKLMNKSKNKNTTEATGTWRNVYLTWVKHRAEVLERKKVEPKKLDEILHFFYGTEKARRTSL